MSGVSLPGGTGQLRLDAPLRGAIRGHLETRYPEEACGGLLAKVDEAGVIRVTAAVPMENDRREERGRRYLIGPDDVVALERRADREGVTVVGYYHSHPDAPAIPSDYDREHAWPGYVYLIVSVRDGSAVEARAWRLLDDRSGFDRVEIIETESFTA